MTVLYTAEPVKELNNFEIQTIEPFHQQHVHQDFNILDPKAFLLYGLSVDVWELGHVWEKRLVVMNLEQLNRLMRGAQEHNWTNIDSTRTDIN